jgi:hypothetical protein
MPIGTQLQNLNDIGEITKNCNHTYCWEVQDKVANVVEFFTIVMLVVKITLHDFIDTNLDVWLVKASFWALIIDCLFFLHLFLVSFIYPIFSYILLNTCN